MVLTSSRTDLLNPDATVLKSVPTAPKLESESWKNCSAARIRDESLPGPATFSHHCLGVTGVIQTRQKE